MLTKQQHKSVRPHYLCLGPDNQLWEYINFPWFDKGQERVGVRVPSDPTTYREVWLAEYKPLSVKAPEGVLLQ